MSFEPGSRESSEITIVGMSTGRSKSSRLTSARVHQPPRRRQPSYRSSQRSTASSPPRRHDAPLKWTSDTNNKSSNLPNNKSSTAFAAAPLLPSIDTDDKKPILSSTFITQATSLPPTPSEPNPTGSKRSIEVRTVDGTASITVDASHLRPYRYFATLLDDLDNHSMVLPRCDGTTLRHLGDWWTRRRGRLLPSLRRWLPVEHSSFEEMKLPDQVMNELRWILSICERHTPTATTATTTTTSPTAIANDAKGVAIATCIANSEPPRGQTEIKTVSPAETTASVSDSVSTAKSTLMRLWMIAHVYDMSDLEELCLLIVSTRCYRQSLMSTRSILSATGSMTIVTPTIDRDNKSVETKSNVASVDPTRTSSSTTTAASSVPTIETLDRQFGLLETPTSEGSAATSPPPADNPNPLSDDDDDDSKSESSEASHTLARDDDDDDGILPPNLVDDGNYHEIRKTYTSITTIDPLHGRTLQPTAKQLSMYYLRLLMLYTTNLLDPRLSRTVLRRDGPLLMRYRCLVCSTDDAKLCLGVINNGIDDRCQCHSFNLACGAGTLFRSIFSSVSSERPHEIIHRCKRTSAMSVLMERLSRQPWTNGDLPTLAELVVMFAQWYLDIDRDARLQRRRAWDAVVKEQLTGTERILTFDPPAPSSTSFSSSASTTAMTPTPAHTPKPLASSTTIQSLKLSEPSPVDPSISHRCQLIIDAMTICPDPSQYREIVEGVDFPDVPFPIVRYIHSLETCIHRHLIFQTDAKLLDGKIIDALQSLDYSKLSDLIHQIPRSDVDRSMWSFPDTKRCVYLDTNQAARDYKQFQAVDVLERIVNLSVISADRDHHNLVLTTTSGARARGRARAANGSRRSLFRSELQRLLEWYVDRFDWDPYARHVPSLLDLRRYAILHLKDPLLVAILSPMERRVLRSDQYWPTRNSNETRVDDSSIGLARSWFQSDLRRQQWFVTELSQELVSQYGDEIRSLLFDLFDTGLGWQLSSSSTDPTLTTFHDVSQPLSILRSWPTHAALNHAGILHAINTHFESASVDPECL